MSSKPIIVPGFIVLVALLLLNIALPVQHVDAQRRTTATPLPTYYVTTNANGRDCPQLNCDIIETFAAGEAVEVTGKKDGATVSNSKVWYQVKVGRATVYVHSSLLTDKKPTPRPTQRATTMGNNNNATGSTTIPAATTVPDVVSTPDPTQPPVVPSYSCAGDIYNCSNFSNRTDLMNYFNACPGDPSKLDQNNDGVPCESL
jgi:hypothetical protein